MIPSIGSKKRTRTNPGDASVSRGEVDDTPRVARKRGAIQPGARNPEQAPDESRRRADGCVYRRLRSRVRRSISQHLLVAQKDEVIQTKCAIVLFSQ